MTFACRRIVSSGLVTGLALATWAAVGAAGAMAASAQLSAAEKASAAALALADGRVQAAVSGLDATVAGVAAWRHQGAAFGRGATVVLTWRRLVSIDATWPVIPRASGADPTLPFHMVQRRLRATGVRGLAVQVDLTGKRVVEIYPRDVPGTAFTMREETSPPYSWLPWFTRRPWVPAPALAIAIIGLLVRARLLSRAWGRRAPSSGRRDRALLARAALVALMGLAVLWLLYSLWYALAHPLLSERTSSPTTLYEVPILVVPAALFVTALILEFSRFQHRLAWMGVFFIAVLGSGFALAVMMRTETTNVLLDAYLVMGVLAVIAVTPGFRSERLRWTRDWQPGGGGMYF